METKKITLAKSLTFILGTIIGLFLVVIPLNFNGKVDTVTFYYLKKFVAFGGQTLQFVIAYIVLISAILAIIDIIFKPGFIRNNKLMSALFSCSLMDTIFRALGAIIAMMVAYQVGPEYIIQPNTGGTMLPLSTQLSILIPPMLLFQTFILEFGFMEFLGTLIGFVVKPLFKVSKMASVSIISAWVGPGNAAILGTKQLYDEGYFTFKEAAIIGTTFATSSVGWVVLVTNILGLMDYFGLFYLTITVVGFIVALIGVRIPPISNYKDLYVNGTTTTDKALDTGDKSSSVAIRSMELACDRVSKVTSKNFTSKIKNMLSYVFFLQPIIICWGTIALMLSEYTKILVWLSYPISWIMKLFGFSGANLAAPAIISGFADNYLPVILAKSMTSPELKFIIGTMSILQIIFMSEIGALLSSTKLAGFKDIVIIFVERTLIALPFVLIITKIIF